MGYRQHHPNGGQRFITVFSTKESQQIIKYQIHSLSTTRKKDKQTTQPKSKSTIFSTKGKRQQIIKYTKSTLSPLPGRRTNRPPNQSRNPPSKNATYSKSIQLDTPT